MLARTGLVQEDINIMVRTAAPMYASRNAEVGKDVIWSNPKTGAFGMAEILEVDGDCVRLVYRFQTRSRKVWAQLHWAAQPPAGTRALVTPLHR